MAVWAAAHRDACPNTRGQPTAGAWGGGGGEAAADVPPRPGSAGDGRGAQPSCPPRASAAGATRRPAEAAVGVHPPPPRPPLPARRRCQRVCRRSARTAGGTHQSARKRPLVRSVFPTHSPFRALPPGSLSLSLATPSPRPPVDSLPPLTSGGALHTRRRAGTVADGRRPTRPLRAGRGAGGEREGEAGGRDGGRLPGVSRRPPSVTRDRIRGGGQVGGGGSNDRPRGDGEGAAAPAPPDRRPSPPPPPRLPPRRQSSACVTATVVHTGRRGVG